VAKFSIMRVFVFGNGNISFADFLTYYQQPISQLLQNIEDLSFLICDFRGTDTLTLEFLKTQSAKVQLCHIGENPPVYFIREDQLILEPITTYESLVSFFKKRLKII